MADMPSHVAFVAGFALIVQAHEIAGELLRRVLLYGFHQGFLSSSLHADFGLPPSEN